MSNYIIPLSQECLEWLLDQPDTTQSLVGWSLVNRGIPRHDVERNYDVTPKDLENMLRLNYGPDYHIWGATHEFRDSFEFVPAYSKVMTKILWFVGKALPYILVFLLGLITGEGI